MYIEIPGSKTHELPPLLVHAAEHRSEQSELASVMLEAEDMLSSADASPEILEQRKFELALKLTEQYHGLLSHWLWGDSVLEWIRQCEITFECEETLRKLLHPDVWPHASRASFVSLLMEKHVATHGVALEKAVGLRLTFRQPPPIDCFSNQFLFYLNSTVADSAYQTWSHLAPLETAMFPPERFHFEVHDLSN
ncbi:MAG TPA: hypothetical protein VG456_20960 [Candidatus Sulfopaludibacter sp.]|jgi:hypothetical protein|nr:hypothetical protein [Candidatus Sulfopaludibacter sp.]